MEVTQSAGPNITGMFLVVITGIVFFLGLMLLILYSKKFFIGWIKYKDREKESLKFVLLQVTTPRDNEIKIDATEQLFATFASLRKSTGRFFGAFKPQPHLSFEIVALHESIRFYVACNRQYHDLVEKQINGAFSDAEIKEVPEYNIFSETGHIAYASLQLKNSDYFPIKTFKDLPTDPLSSLTSALAKMQPSEGAAVQMIISPADSKWKDAGKKW